MCRSAIVSAVGRQAVKYLSTPVLTIHLSTIREVCGGQIRWLFAACLVVCAAWLGADARDAEHVSDEAVLYVFPYEQAATALTGWRVAQGDSAHWSAPEYPDSAWDIQSGVGLWVRRAGGGAGVRWYRKEIFLPEPLDSFALLALYQRSVVSASEIYWDGVLVARNGTVGESAVTERAGHSAFMATVPSELTRPGRHSIAQRVSNFSTFSGVVESPLLIGEYGSLHRLLVREVAILLFMAGMFFFTGLFHLVTLFGYRERKPYAVFATFCLACAGHIFIQALRQYFQMDLSQYYIWAAINDIPWFLMMWLLPAFFMYEFSFPRKVTLSLIIAGVALLVVGLPRLVTTGVLPVCWLDPLVAANNVHGYLTIVLAAAVTVWARARRNVGALTATMGLVAFLLGALITGIFALEYGWMLGFAMLILFLTVSLGRQMSQLDREYQEAQVRAARLELELLRKHIQPHFLLNSLNSIVAWLEEEPATAARLVQSLADELRMLLKFSSVKSVPLADEVRLCQAHLEVMGLRYGKSYRIEIEGSLPLVEIPPLVLHTLVENGLTHGYAGRDAGVFRFACVQRERTLVMDMFNDGAVEGAGGARGEGTGTRYVRSRLEELYPGRWRFTAGPAQGGWRASIAIEGWR